MLKLEARPQPSQWWSLGSRQTGGYLALRHHVQAVADVKQLFNLFANHQNRTAAVTQLEQLAAYLRGGAHIHAPGRLRHDQQ